MLNSRMGSIAGDEKLKPLKTDIQTLKNSFLSTNQKIKRLEQLQEQDEELKSKFATFVSYGDKKRMNAVIKDVNLIKKQINLSKTSKIFIMLQKLEQRLDDLENSLVSDFEEQN